jgi:hypothetical protein
MMLESALQGKVVLHARAKGVLARKLDFGMGWPDVMFLYEGRVLFIEFKNLEGSLTKLQRHVHAELENHGFHVAVIRTVEDGVTLIDNWCGILGGQPPKD